MERRREIRTRGRHLYVLALHPTEQLVEAAVRGRGELPHVSEHGGVVGARGHVSAESAVSGGWDGLEYESGVVSAGEEGGGWGEGCL